VENNIDLYIRTIGLVKIVQVSGEEGIEVQEQDKIKSVQHVDNHGSAL
jgi:hypothetical protein